MWRDGADVKVKSNSDMSLEWLGIWLCHCPKIGNRGGRGHLGADGRGSRGCGDELGGSIL